MSSRGRGYSRGGRGGSNYRGSSNSYRGNSSRAGGGGYSSRGRNNSYNTSSSYAARSSDNRYPSSSSNDRFSSNRSDGYKRVPEYRGGSSRDRTPERKRSRYEQGTNRNHEYGGSSGEYSSTRNYDTYEHKRDNRNSRTPQPLQEEHVRSPFRNRQSSTSSRRSRELMGPPKRVPLRSTRGATYRGRLSSRGLRTSRVLIRRTDMRTIQQKRSIPSTKSREYLRSLKLARLRSSIKKKHTLERHSSESRKDRKRGADDDKEERPSKDAEKKKSHSTSKKKDSVGGDGNEKDEHTKKVDDKEESPTVAANKKPKAKSVSLKKDKEKTSENEDDKVNTDKDEGTGGDNNNETLSDNEKLSKKDSSMTSVTKYGKSFIKLTCVHCLAKCRTFKEYSQHLHDRNHKMVMSKIYMSQKSKLSRMRQQQRNNQRNIEENGDSKSRPQFCPLCRLNYRQPKVKHQLSVGHKSMKKFLMPHCRICSITFKGPMIYEAHRCSLDHIRRKALSEKIKQSQDSDDDDKELDLNNFMTVDSVGDVDGNDDTEEANDEHNEKKEEINVGAEHVKKVETYYCELCCSHLSQHEEYEIALKRHCSSNNHLRAYLQYREDKHLRKAAEKAHRKHQESKDNKDKEKKEDKETWNKTVTTTGEDSEADDVEEKMWASVDQDLGELLREVGPENGNPENDDDEDEGSTANVERYDRFKNSEMKKSGDVDIKADNVTEDSNDFSKEEKSKETEVVESKS